MTTPQGNPPEAEPGSKHDSALPDAPFVYETSVKASRVSSKAGRRIFVALLVAALLASIGLLAWGWRTASDHDAAAKGAVIGLLTALQSGEVSQALTYLESFESSEEPLLVEGALRLNEEAFAFGEELTLVETTSNTQKYRVPITIHGVEQMAVWTVAQHGDEWLIDPLDVVHQISLLPDQPYLINGVEVTAATAGRDVAALPGSYAVESGLALLHYPPTTVDVFTAGQTTLDVTLFADDGVRPTVVSQVRTILESCVAETSQPTACGWPLDFDNGLVKDGTVSWEIIPDDPAAELTMPVGPWLASTDYEQNLVVLYETSASGEGVLSDGGDGLFEDVVLPRSTQFSVNLAGAEPVVTLN